MSYPTVHTNARADVEQATTVAHAYCCIASGGPGGAVQAIEPHAHLGDLSRISIRKREIRLDCPFSTQDQRDGG
jgi:hypothetical protein